MRAKLKFIFILLFLLSGLCSFSASQTAPNEGIRTNNPKVNAFINARIITAPGKIIESGTVVIRNSKIEAVGEKISPPTDAKIWDMKGMTIYPGFIESNSIITLQKPTQPSSGGIGESSRIVRAPAEKPKGPVYWNEKVQARQNAEEIYNPDEKSLEKLRSQGFTSAVIVSPKGFFRGSSALVSLSNNITKFNILKNHVAQNLTFNTEPGSFSEGYPNSLMGIIALIRQVFYDADWYQKAWEKYEKDHSLEKPEMNEDLEILNRAILNKSKFVFEVNDEQNFIRAIKILKEFSLSPIICGNGYEYRRIDAIKKFNVPIILPLNFPEPPAVSSPEEALSVSLQELLHWETALANPKIVSEVGIQFALSSANLKDQSSFLTQVRRAIQFGLSPDAALAALTTTPARLFSVEKDLGTIEKGKYANLIITDGEIFAEKTKINEVWVDGERYEVKPKAKIDPRGAYSITFKFDDRSDTARIILKGETDKYDGSLLKGRKDIKLTITSPNLLQISLNFSGDSIGLPGMIRMTGNIQKDEITGIGELSDGKQFNWSGKLTTPYTPLPELEKKRAEKITIPEIQYPSVGFGRKVQPEQPENLLIKNATIWTCGPQGILKNADLLIKKGKINLIGSNLPIPKDALVIDATGKNITPGIIDCHSHTAVSGSANETGKTLTSETRIADVIDCDDISIYRQLAGGTTAAMILHGSANPIGGQTAIIKYRWGSLGDEMILENFTPGLKFALGENVKQSNFTDRLNPNPRYPQTRMGVEQIMADEFQAALDYKKANELYEKTKKGITPRKNLELDPIIEILEGKRQAHVHAYRQDEILMMMRLAERFNFQIASFIHILEGYKVADIMAKHGATATSFSDWWGYKFEVWDAIPYNGVIMDAVGVSVSFNSDSDELARRLNLEASKVVKYGGITPENALKFVTINTAKQLKIDKKIGSLEPGKDADFVIWNGDPLSTYTICEQTWIDGKKYFDRKEDLIMREDIQKERARIIQKILATKKEEKPTGRFPLPEKKSENETSSVNSSEEISK